MQARGAPEKPEGDNLLLSLDPRARRHRPVLYARRAGTPSRCSRCWSGPARWRRKPNRRSRRLRQEPHIAAPLKVSPGSPLLKIVRIMRDKTGRAIQHITAYYRAGAVSAITMHLQRDAENGPAWTPVDRK